MKVSELFEQTLLEALSDEELANHVLQATELYPEYGPSKDWNAIINMALRRFPECRGQGTIYRAISVRPQSIIQANSNSDVQQSIISRFADRNRFESWSLSSRGVLSYLEQVYTPGSKIDKSEIKIYAIVRQRSEYFDYSKFFDMVKEKYKTLNSPHFITKGSAMWEPWMDGKHLHVNNRWGTNTHWTGGMIKSVQEVLALMTNNIQVVGYVVNGIAGNPVKLSKTQDPDNTESIDKEARGWATVHLRRSLNGRKPTPEEFKKVYDMYVQQEIENRQEEKRRLASTFSKKRRFHRPEDFKQMKNEVEQQFVGGVAPRGKQQPFDARSPLASARSKESQLSYVVNNVLRRGSAE